MLAYRRAAARVRETSGPVAQLALDGRAKDLPGIGKTIEEKIVQIVEDGEIHALTKHKALVPEDVVRFTRLPGPRAEDRAARSGRSSGSRPFAELEARRPSSSSCATLPGHRRRRARRRCSRRSRPARPSRRRTAAGSCSGAGCPRCRRSSRCCARIPRRSKVSEAGSVAPAQGDLPRPRHHRHRHRPARADRLLHEARAGSRRSPRRATRRRPSSRTTACASTSASCRRRATATCSSTSPARRTTTSRCARTPSGAGSRSPSTASRTSRRARCFTFGERGGALRRASATS